jgi:hypothetical protein
MSAGDAALRIAPRAKGAPRSARCVRAGDDRCCPERTTTPTRMGEAVNNSAYPIDNSASSLTRTQVAKLPQRLPRVISFRPDTTTAEEVQFVGSSRVFKNHKSRLASCDLTESSARGYAANLPRFHAAKRFGQVAAWSRACCRRKMVSLAFLVTCRRQSLDRENNLGISLTSTV